jgi:hypothetical protein
LCLKVFISASFHSRAATCSITKTSMMMTMTINMWPSRYTFFLSLFHSLSVIYSSLEHFILFVIITEIFAWISCLKNNNHFLISCNTYSLSHHQKKYYDCKSHTNFSGVNLEEVWLIFTRMWCSWFQRIEQ